MKELTAKNVHEVFRDCLFDDVEPKINPVFVEGIMHNYGFHPERLKSHEAEIIDMLLELPDDFHKDKGGGMSFLNACMTRHGIHWAEHSTIEMLLVLGIASGHAKIQFPREFWSSLPGGMPYFSVGL